MPRGTWGRQHPELDRWLRGYTGDNNFLIGLREWLVDHDSLTPSQTNHAQRHFDRHRAGAMEPGDWNANNIVVHNGHYNLQVPSLGISHNYKIHTIRRSRTDGLVNKRVISFETAVGWHTFAFINSDGTMQVWRRWERDRDSLYQIWAWKMVVKLHGGREEPFLSNHSSSPAAPFRVMSVLEGNTTVEIFIRGHRTCIRCNRTIVQRANVRRGYGNCCAPFLEADVTETTSTGGNVRISAARVTYSGDASRRAERASRSASVGLNGSRHSPQTPYTPSRISTLKRSEIKRDLIQ